MLGWFAASQGSGKKKNLGSDDIVHEKQWERTVNRLSSTAKNGRPGKFRGESGGRDQSNVVT